MKELVGPDWLRGCQAAVQNSGNSFVTTSCCERSIADGSTHYASVFKVLRVNPEECIWGDALFDRQYVSTIRHYGSGTIGSIFAVPPFDSSVPSGVKIG